MIKLFRMMTIGLCFLLSACGNSEENKILFFTQPGCIHCDHARTYIKQNYAGRADDIREINVREPQNMPLLMSAVKKMKINANSIGTPFIVIGDDYIMGWGTKDVHKFNSLVKTFHTK